MFIYLVGEPGKYARYIAADPQEAKRYADLRIPKGVDVYIDECQVHGEPHTIGSREGGVWHGPVSDAKPERLPTHGSDAGFPHGE